jgi:hypothetical protein
LRQRIEDAIATANIGAWRRQVEEEVAVERLKAMSESVRRQMLEDRPESTNPEVGGAQVLYPVLLKSVSRSSPPAKVLSEYQPKIREINAEIHRAQDALRRLIQSNTQSEEERLEWTRESAEATTDAQNLAVSLVYDLVGARVDYLAEINGKERAVVFNQLVNRAEADGRSRSLHTAYGILLNRKQELESLKIHVGRASKLNELSTMIRESANQSAMENLWDLVSQLRKWKISPDRARTCWMPPTQSTGRPPASRIWR